MSILLWNFATNFQCKLKRLLFLKRIFECINNVLQQIRKLFFLLMTIYL